MPSYAKCRLAFPCSEKISVAMNDGKVLGAVSICHKDISLIPGEWKDGFEQSVTKLPQKVTGGWMSKLYVFPQYHDRGIGRELTKEAVKSLKEENFDEVYAGIYVRNKFRKVSRHIFEKNGFARAVQQNQQQYFVRLVTVPPL
jgi:ribosomal protein S18 acetylase RimI-like enzyme